VTPRELFQSDDLSWLQKPDAEVESSSIERKRWADKDKVAQQLSAFANGSTAGGLLVLGVENTGEIVGVDERAADRLLPDLADCIDACRLESRRVQFEGKTVLLFFVPYSPDKVICISKGAAYFRRGATTAKLSDAEIRELRFSRREGSFEDLPAAPWKPELIDKALLESYLDARRRKNGLTLDLSVEEALRSRSLLVETQHGLMLTNAGVLAFARNPFAILPGARLHLLRFDGTDEKFGTERNVTKDRWFEGPIPQIVASAREFIRTLVREFDYLGPNGKFITEPEYPEPAWDEAIVNALVHRSYSLSNAAVSVRIFDDRMEIESPGGFPGPARERESHPRNPHLMDALRYFDLVRLTREGTRRMAEEMRKLELPPPEFSEPTGFSVLVVLRNDLERRRQRQAAPNLDEKWSETAKLIDDPLAIYRGRGLALWDQLVQGGAKPSSMVLAAALRALMSSDLPVEQRRPFIDRLRREANALPKQELDTLIAKFTQGGFASQSDLEGQIGLVLRESAEARTQLLQWLETCPPAVDPAAPSTRPIEHALWALQADLGSRPMPDRDYVQRLLSILRRHTATRAAQQIYENITGHPLK
jgi:ATP-dependent DNA helicase RecG